MYVRRPSFGYALATVVLVAVVAWAGRITWLELGQLHRGMAAVQADAFHRAEHIEASVRKMKEDVLNFDLDREPVDRTAFGAESRALTEWFQTRQDAVSTPQELDLLRQIETAFDGYVTSMNTLLEERARAGAAPSLRSVLERVEEKTAHLLDLCRKLKGAERAAQSQFLKDSHGAVGWVRRLLLVQLALLLFVVGTALVAIYRGVIGPLRVELGDSRARADRHEKLASLGTLAAGVAHEIRNPLTAINVRVHSLKKSLAANSSEQEDAQVIDHEIQRLERIVQEFLEFARPAEPRLVTVSADGLLTRMQALFGPQLEKPAIRLNLESVPDIWVRVDPHQMEQVLINLIQNAAESIEGEGAITLRARSGKGRLAGRSCPVVVLEVSDTGKGIPPEVQKRMFDPFFTTKEEGTGLGLAITARIVEKHGGALECRSEAHRGTTFTLLLPQAKSDTNDENAT